MQKHTWTALLAATILTVSLAGCAGTPGLTSSSPSGDGTTGPVQTEGSSAETGQTTAPTETTSGQQTPTQGNMNRLTGLNDMAGQSNARAVGIMIGNNTRSRPQYGLDKADLFVEAETEGGITRIMAVFSSADRVPAQLGPVRSARSPFVLMAQSLDLVYSHAGGSKGGLNTVQTSGIAAINALAYDGSTFWRDAGLKASKGQEYSMMVSGKNLASRVSALGFRTTSDRTPFTFGKSTRGSAANNVQVYMTGAQTVSFAYNTASGLYTKQNGKLGSAAHTAADGTPITVSNVLVMFDSKYAENSETINFRLSSGSGLLCSGGTVRNIRWSRSANGLQFTEEDGSSMTMGAGKTYICLVDKSYSGNTVTK